MTSRKRRADGDENEASMDNVIADSPRNILPQDNDLLHTPKQGLVAANAGTPTDAVVIPGTGTAREPAEINNNQIANGNNPNNNEAFVTPHHNGHRSKAVPNNPNARRAIFPLETLPPPVTPSQQQQQHPQNDVSTADTNIKTTSDNQLSAAVTITPPKNKDGKEPPAKRRLIFGRYVDELVYQPNTKRVYGIIKKLTGAIGGNASCGPIYGELTMGSMQKMVNLMREHTRFDNQSRFIDVGSGIGKPNLHVTQDPGVAFSCGIEMELDRYRLGLKCLQRVLQEATLDSTKNNRGADADDDDDAKIRYNCAFIHGNIMEAQTFDPFTHVYMFSIGFPPKLWVYLSEAWNRSKSPYMICFHGPKAIIDDYAFEVELLAQTPTSMHGSKEGHTGYIYQRKGITSQDVSSYVQNEKESNCDPVFRDAYRQVKAGLETLRQSVDQTVEANWSAKRSMTRSAARKQGVILSKTTDKE